MKVTLDDAGEYTEQAFSTIICEGDAIGAVIICNKDEKKKMNDNQKTVKVIHMAPLGSGGISKLTVTINELIADNIQFDYLVFRNKKEFLEDLGIEKSGLEKLIVASYRLLGLLSFLTSGEDETRAWTIKVGTKAPQAAGKIHTDFERGFIKAEVVNYQDLLDCGSYAGAREKGLVRMEGKEYVVQDGDVILFRFNV